MNYPLWFTLEFNQLQQWISLENSEFFLQGVQFGTMEFEVGRII